MEIRTYTKKSVRNDNLMSKCMTFSLSIKYIQKIVIEKIVTMNYRFCSVLTSKCRIFATNARRGEIEMHYFKIIIL